MKKAVSLILALMLCLSLCACGGGNAEPAETTTEPKPELTAESVAGSYKTTMWFLDETITLNSNTSYTSTNGSKGTFSVSADGIITLDPVDSSSIDRTFRYTDGRLVDYKDWVFEEDDEFGLVFSPDENGLTEQTFQDCVINSRMPGCDHNWFALILKKDGSFELRLGTRYTTSIDIKEECKGTYKYADEVLTLTYEGQDYPMYISGSKYIQFQILEKVQ